VLQQTILAGGLAISIWVFEARVYLLVLLIGALGLWHKSVLGGCPLTIVESQLAKKQKLSSEEKKIVSVIRLMFFPRRNFGAFAAVGVAVIFIVLWLYI
jgi:hypothetical protein